MNSAEIAKALRCCATVDGNACDECPARWSELKPGFECEVLIKTEAADLIERHANAESAGGGVMERLNCLRCAYRHEDNGNCMAVGGFCTAVPAAHCRLLQKYEDTGLLPESVEALKLSMMGKAISEITEFNGLPIDRLKELAGADKERRVLVLPCKVGDTLWLTASYYTERLPQPMEARVVRIKIDAGDEITYTTTKGIARDKNFGKTVFLSREEAERALEARKDG